MIQPTNHPPRPYDLPMRFGIVDIGANSVHLLIVQVWQDGTYSRLHKDRAMIRLGRSVFDKGIIDPTTQAKALSALRKFAAFCQNQQCQFIRTIATSAVREATNSRDFIDAVHEATSLNVEVISGEDEARLTALGCTSSLGIHEGTALVMDVGGGTTEIAWIEDDQPKKLWSLAVGPVRILEQLELNDPPRQGGLEQIRQVAMASLQPLFDAGLTIPPHVLATSGTALTLGEFCGTKGRATTALETTVIIQPSLRNLMERLADMTLQKRRAWLGRYADRADTLIQGGMIFLTAMEELGIDRMFTGGKSLREGVTLESLHQEILPNLADGVKDREALLSEAEGTPAQRSVRARNVLHLARRYGYNPVHCSQVAKLACKIFDALRPLHWLDDQDRFYLEATALLHDIGYHINSCDHNQHSAYLIRNTELEGFHPMEVNLLANIVRYHRAELPSMSHPDFAALPEGLRQKTNILAAILRVAEALDFTNHGLVEDLQVDVSDESICICAYSTEPLELETQEIASQSDLLEKVFQRHLEVVYQVIDSKNTEDSKVESISH